MKKNIVVSLASLALACNITAFGMNNEQPKNNKRQLESSASEILKAQENKKQKREVQSNPTQDSLIFSLKHMNNSLEKYSNEKLRFLAFNILANPLVLEGKNPKSMLFEHDLVKVQQPFYANRTSRIAETITSNAKKAISTLLGQCIKNRDTKTIKKLLENGAHIDYENLLLAQELYEQRPNYEAFSDIHTLLLETCIKQPERFDTIYDPRYAHDIDDFSDLSDTTVKRLTQAVLASNTQASKLPYQLILDLNILKADQSIVQEIIEKYPDFCVDSILLASDSPHILDYLLTKHLTNKNNFNTWYFCGDDFFPRLDPQIQASIGTREMDPNIKLSCICYGLQAAGSISDIEALSKQVQPDYVDKYGHYFVHYAIFSGNQSAIKACLECFPGFDINYQNKRQNNDTISQEALEHALNGPSDAEIFNLIIKNPSLNLSVQNEFGETALHSIIKRISPNWVTPFEMYMANCLIEKSPDLTIKNNIGQTALDLALQKKLYSIAALFTLDSRCPDGNTALHYALRGAVKSFHNDDALSTKIASEIIYSLLKNGANNLMNDETGTSPDQLVIDIETDLRTNRNQYSSEKFDSLAPVCTFFQNLTKDLIAFCSDPAKFVKNQYVSISKVPAYALFNIILSQKIYNKLIDNQQTGTLKELAEQCHNLRISETRKNSVNKTVQAYILKRSAEENFHDCIIKFGS